MSPDQINSNLFQTTPKRLKIATYTQLQFLGDKILGLALLIRIFYIVGKIKDETYDVKIKCCQKYVRFVIDFSDLLNQKMNRSPLIITQFFRPVRFVDFMLIRSALYL